MSDQEDSLASGDTGEAGDCAEHLMEMESEHEEDESDQTEDQNDDDGKNNQISKWPDEETARLIEMYRERPFLYDLANKWYLNKNKKNRAYLYMAGKLNISGR